MWPSFNKRYGHLLVYGPYIGQSWCTGFKFWVLKWWLNSIAFWLLNLRSKRPWFGSHPLRCRVWRWTSRSCTRTSVTSSIIWHHYKRGGKQEHHATHWCRWSTVPVLMVLQLRLVCGWRLKNQRSLLQAIDSEGPFHWNIKDDNNICIVSSVQVHWPADVPVPWSCLKLLYLESGTICCCPQTDGLVIQPFLTVAEDVFIWTVRPQRSLNPHLSVI